MPQSDLNGQDPFVFDVIEPLRPRVDERLLTLLNDRVFTASDFFEAR